MEYSKGSMVAAAACARMLFVNSLSLGAAFLALKEKLSPGQGQKLLLLLSLLAMDAY